MLAGEVVESEYYDLYWDVDIPLEGKEAKAFIKSASQTLMKRYRITPLIAKVWANCILQVHNGKG